jgi:hypothetical protein
MPRKREEKRFLGENNKIEDAGEDVINYNDDDRKIMAGET